MAESAPAHSETAKSAIEVGCLWIGGPLSFLEKLCLKSMVRHGASVTLFSYEEVGEIPEGVKHEDAANVVPWNPALIHKKTQSPALMSDLFRYHMMQQRPGMIWCDTDLLFLKPLVPDEGFIFGWESQHLVNGALAGLPPQSETLKELLEFSQDEHPVPPWLPEDAQEELRQNRLHVSEMKWGTWGPAAFTYFLRKTGEIRYAAPRKIYHPVPFKDVRDLILAKGDAARWIKDETVTVHLYGRATRRIVRERFGGAPPWRSYLATMMREYDIRAPKRQKTPE